MRHAVQNDAAEGLKEYLKVHCSGRDFFISRVALQPLDYERKGR